VTPPTLDEATGDPLPALAAARLTFAMAAPLTVAVTALDVAGHPAVLAVYWSLTAGAGVAAFHPRGSERARAAFIAGAWMLAAVGTLLSQGLVCGPAILLAAIALVGLFFGARLALAASVFGALAVAAAAFGHARGLLPTPPDGPRLWLVHGASFFCVSAMTAIVQAAVLRRSSAAAARARHFALVAERADSGVVITRTDRRIEWVNDAFTRRTGYSQAEAHGHTPAELLQGPATSDADQSSMRTRLDAGEGFTRELINYTKGREPYWTRVEVRPFLDDRGRLLGFSGVQVDVTAERMRAELAWVERSLSAALSRARSEDEGYLALVAALADSPAVISARAWGLSEAEPRLVASRRPLAARFAPGLVDRSIDEAPVPLAPGQLARIDRRDGAPIPHSLVSCAIAAAQPGLVEIAISDDVPGRAELTERLPELAARVALFLDRRVEQERFEALFEHSPDALILVDDDGRVAQHNGGALAMWPGLGVGADLTSLAPDLGAAFVELRNLRASSPDIHRTVAWQTPRTGACPLDVEASLAPIPLRAGRGVLVAVRDVTARRNAERAWQASLVEVSRTLAEREVLLKEIHHRVKNNLQLVSSLLGLQADRAASDEARLSLSESAHRVRSMSLIHQMLYGSGDLAHVDLAGYARALASELRAAFDRSAELSLLTEPVDLSVEQAIPCGLILNELITNALKHGRSSDGRCRLRIEIARAGPGLTVAVSDDGPGLPPGFDAAPRGSLGLQLIDALVRQLGASLSTRNERGARFSVAIPGP